MKKQLNLCIGVLGFIFSWFLTPANLVADVDENTYADKTTDEAQLMIDANRDNENFVILDVRTPSEFAEDHLSAAVNLDFYSPTFRDDLNQLDKTKAYLIYCRSGNRSGKTLAIFKELNFHEGYNMLGGIKKWKVEGRPVTRD